jgi:class 3 adenylate cyclase
VTSRRKRSGSESEEMGASGRHGTAPEDANLGGASAGSHSAPRDPIGNLAKQVELWDKSLASSAMVSFAKQVEALNKSLGSSVIAGVAKQIEAMNKSLASVGMASVAKQVEAMNKALGSSAMAGVAKQVEAMNKALGSGAMAGVAKQVEAMNKALGSGAMASVAKQVEAMNKSLGSASAASLAERAALFQRPLVPSISIVSREPEVREPVSAKASVLPEVRQYPKRHAPPGWETSEEASRFVRAINGRNHVSLIVLAADIRSSTVLMKEAGDSYEFAKILQEFIERAQETVWDREGIFDNFTGDGFLAYWSFTQTTKKQKLRSVLSVARQLHGDFRDRHLPLFRANSQNFPEKGIGLAIGLDEGNAYPVVIANDPTIIGPAVVGAVRMVKQAGPGETVANVRLGSYLESIQGRGSFKGVAGIPLPVPSDPYGFQTAYAVTFSEDGSS